MSKLGPSDRGLRTIGSKATWVGLHRKRDRKTRKEPGIQKRKEMPKKNKEATTDPGHTWGWRLKETPDQKAHSR